MALKKPARSGVNTFMAELLFTILFFLLGCAVLLKLFLAADRTSEHSVALTRAVFIAQSAAEALRGDEGAEKALQELYPGVVVPGMVHEEDEYQLKMEVTEKAGLRGVLEQVRLTVYYRGEPIYSLDTANYRKGEVGA